MYLRLLGCFCLAGLAIQGWGQPRISDVRFDGLEKTRQTHLYQFVRSLPGTIFDSAAVEADRQRLANLSMFANVETTILADGPDVLVVHNCQEIHTLLPIFNFGGVRDNFWFQVGASEANLAGRGHQLSAFYQYYDRSSVSIHLLLDRIQKSKWGLILNLVRWSTVEPLFFPTGTGSYEYVNNNFGIGGLYHFNYRTRLELSTAFFTEDYNRIDNNFIAEAPQQANTSKQLMKTILTTDRLNYHFYYLSDWRNQLNIEAVYSYDGDPDFYIIFDELKYFWRSGPRGNIASRLRIGISSNDVGAFAPFVLDSYLNIRGVGNRVDRGTAMIILNQEYRHTIYDRGQVAIQGVGFTDFGTWRAPGGSLSDIRKSKNFEWYAGGGLRFIHKQFFNAVFRVDYAIDVQTPLQNGFVIGVGQYF